MDEICDCDEGYDRDDAYEFGWCYECKCKVLLEELSKIGR